MQLLQIYKYFQWNLGYLSYDKSYIQQNDIITL